MHRFSIAIFTIIAFSMLVAAQEHKPEQAKTSPSNQKLAVTGKLTRSMAIGGESTGWMIELDSETTIEGKPVHSIEVSYSKPDKLEKLVDQRVKAKGKLAHRQGTETGDRTILEISSIKPLK